MEIHKEMKRYPVDANNLTPVSLPFISPVSLLKSQLSLRYLVDTPGVLTPFLRLYSVSPSL